MSAAYDSTTELLPPDLRDRYGKQAERSQREPRVAIKLMCISCCGWEYNEAKRCQISGCPLWTLSNRIFNREMAQGR